MVAVTLPPITYANYYKLQRVGEQLLNDTASYSLHLNAERHETEVIQYGLTRITQ